MTQVEIRKLIIKALYQDDWLYDKLVLKGGNALSMIYKVGSRTSLDLDFSISDDFKNPDEVSKRIKKALNNTFLEKNIHLFDYAFNPKPKKTNAPWWGGYQVEFKLILKNKAKELGYNTDSLRRQSLTVAPSSQRRIYSIEISKYEYIKDYNIKEYDGIKILIYSPLLLAVEKLRALLQQHPDYTQISAEVKRSRARDLYDIWIICDYFTINLSAHLDVVEAVFNAKKVNMKLLGEMETVKDLHYSSWADVELSVSDEIEDFDFYFNYVNNYAKELYSKWKINSP